MTDQLTGLQYLRARYYNPSSGTFNRLDPFVGNFRDPQSLHKYLYTHGDPVNGIDPSGLWTQAEGYLAEDEITAVYLRDHLGDEAPLTLPSGNTRKGITFGRWAFVGDNVKLKPDILNHTKKRFVEIKPLSPSGISAGIVQMGVYSTALAVAGYRAEWEWEPSNTTIQIGTTFATFFNIGGLVFYTDLLDLSEDAAILAAIRLAQISGEIDVAVLRGLLRRPEVARGLVNAGMRIQQMVRLGTSATSARAQARVGIIPIGGIGLVAGC